MTSTARACLGLLTLGCCFAFAACGDDDDDGSSNTAGQKSDAGAPSHGGSGSHPEGGAEHGGAGHGEASLACRVLGELCHAADSGTGPAHDCHEVGHVGHADDCRAQFDSCVETCTEVDIGAGGAGSDAKCAALGSLCHEAGEFDDAAKECHELGHLGNAANCAKEFDSCATLCLKVLDENKGNPGGAGGGGHGGAAGHDSGGAPSAAGGAAQ